MSLMHVARRPIFELGRGLYGYDLLYRRSTALERGGSDDAAESSEALAKALLGIELRKQPGAGVAFVSFSRAQLLNGDWELFKPDTIVIELPADIPCDDEVLAACTRLVKGGYRLALDDYTPDERMGPLVALASIVKIDVSNRRPSELRYLSAQLRPTGIRMLAKRVETATVRDICADLGYELFQGYLFSRPERLTKTEVSASQLTVMRLLNLLRDPGTADPVLDGAFQAEIALSYKLLRVVDGAALGGRRVTSISHAARVVGREMLHRWLSVLFIASLGRRGEVSRELALTAITRARMCELVTATSPNRERSGAAFIAGLFSLLDVLLEVPMRRILGRLRLSDEIGAALLERAGTLAAPLQLVEAYEKANWDVVNVLARDQGVAEDAMPGLYLEALHWASGQVAG